MNDENRAHGKTSLARIGRPREEDAALSDATASFHDRFVELFESHFARLHRVVDRLSGDSELAADVVQEAFVRLYRRGSMPDVPAAWVITVALNRFRNERTTRSRRLRLLTPARSEHALGDPPPTPEQAMNALDSRRHVRSALDRLPERDRHLLLLHAEGYRYREIATALKLNPASVGVMLARARTSFRALYQEATHAS